MKEVKDSSHHHDQENHTHQSHEYDLRAELLCHLPYASFSLGIGFVLLSLMHFIGRMFTNNALLLQGYHLLFHSFHYLHILYASMGTLVTFSRFSRSLGMGIVLAIISPAIFCTLSDVMLPALAGELLGVSMHIHICFFHELHNVVPLMLVGVMTGLALRQHHEAWLGFFSLGSHFVHILISALASLLYVVAYGFEHWFHYMGLLYFLLIIAVVVPCTISDIVVPIYFAKMNRHHIRK